MDLTNLEPRVTSLEKTLSAFIDEQHQQRDALFRKMDEQSRDHNNARDAMARDLGAKIDAIKDGDRPNLMVIYTGLGVLAAVFGIIAGGLMWSVDREFAHVRTEYIGEIESVKAKLEAATVADRSDITRLRDWRAEMESETRQHLWEMEQRQGIRP